ncbi:MAG: hypothetical protein IPP12_22140 [Nitrospira sp.]|nr:hypothetical protein [Nitrospira sp.]
MSVKAEHRWQRKLVREAAAHEATAHERAVIESLNAVTLEPDALELFCKTVVRESRFGVDLMNREHDGWASSSRWYKSMRDVMRRWNVIVYDVGTDDCSFFYRVRPAKPGERPHAP